jgi:TonB family protein
MRALLPILLLLAQPAWAAKPPPPPAPPAPPAEPPPAALTAPVALGTVAPVLPVGALPPGSPPAQVVITLAIDTEGKVQDAEFATSSGLEAVDAAALRAAMALRFHPATQGGEPVAVTLDWAFTFLPEPPPPPEVPPSTLRGRLEVKGSKEPGAGLTMWLHAATALDATKVTDSAEDWTLSDDPVAEITTDADGAFVFTDLPPGDYIVVVGGGTFRLERLLERLEAGTQREVLYRLRPTGLSETVVVARPQTDTPVRELTREEVWKMPGGGGDPLAAVQALPGVVHVAPDWSGSQTEQTPIIRGAAPEDSVFFLDGLPIPLLIHPMSFQTVTGDYLLDSAYLLPAAAPAAYGDHTGGVVGATLRSPRQDRVGGFLQPGIGMAAFALEGPITKKSRFYVGLRRSYFDLIIKLVMPRDSGFEFLTAPFFQDQQIMLELDASKAIRLNLSYIGTIDGLRMVATPEEGVEELLFDQKSELHRFALKGDMKLGALGKNRAIAALTLWNQGLQFLEFFERRERHTTFHFADDVRLEPLPFLAVEGGVMVEVDGQRLTEDMPLMVREDTGPRQPSPLEENLAGTTQSTRVWVGGYVGLPVKPVKQVTITPQFRLDGISGLGTVMPQLRANVGIEPIDGLRISLAGGRYLQSPSRTELSAISGNPDLAPEGAWHVNVGVNAAPVPQFSIDLQGYAKFLDHQVVSAASAPLADALSLLGGEQQGDDPTHGLSNDGIGRVFGAEVFSRWNLFPGGRLRGWFGYSLAWAQRKDTEAEEWRYFQYDRRHALTALLQVFLPGEFSIGGRWQLQTGVPETPVLGSIYYADYGFYAPVYGKAYSERSKPYHQLDVRIDKRIRRKDHYADVFVDIVNIYASRNEDFTIWSEDYDESAHFQNIPSVDFGVRVEF